MRNTILIDGYHAVIEYDPDIEMFRGQFVDINGGADFYARDVATLKREAKISLGVFLDMCREDGVEPRRMFSGKFNLRLSPELHANITAAAQAKGESVNQWITDQLGEVVNVPPKKSVDPSPKRNTKPDKIDEKAIAWAIKHLQKHGDTDIFPRPFEYLLLDTDTVRDYVKKIDLSSYDTSDARICAVPKSGLEFRMSHQLDPIDALIYAAFIYELSGIVERNRVPVKDRVACSYRIQSSSSGDLFPSDNGWTNYDTMSRALANRYKYVLHVDIASFYNQIYHHRLQGALQRMGVGAQRSTNIGRFLGMFTARQSQGIPIGPAASHVLAEACLDDVDQFLMDKEFQLTRYADDFRLFVNSVRDARDALRHLTHYLYTAHRLAIQSSKTRIQLSSEFLACLESDERRKEEEDERILDEYVQNLIGYGDIGIEELMEDTSDESQPEVLTRLFENALDSAEVRTGTIQHLLRRSRSPALHQLVLDNLELLIPVFRDVCLYFLSTFPEDPGTAREIGDIFIDFAQNSEYSCEFIRMWVLHMLQDRPAMAEYRDADTLAEKSECDLGKRPRALLAKAYHKAPWVRQQKETIMSLSSWDRRAVIYAADILPDDEKVHWLKTIKARGDTLDRAIASYLLSSRKRAA